jgi:hypothetical protein
MRRRIRIVPSHVIGQQLVDAGAIPAGAGVVEGSDQLLG